MRLAFSREVLYHNRVEKMEVCPMLVNRFGYYYTLHDTGRV